MKNTLYVYSKRVTAIISLFLVSLSVVSLNGQSRSDHQVLQELKTLLEQNKSYTEDKSAEWQRTYLELMKEVYKIDALKAGAETVITDFLKTELPNSVKNAIWTDFANIATERSLPLLLEKIKICDDEALAMAIIDKAELRPGKDLAKLYPGASPGMKVSIINHFGVMKDESGLKVLKQAVIDPSPVISAAALSSIARIGTLNSVKILQSKIAVPGKTIPVGQCEDILICAERVAAAGEEESAKGLYDALTVESYPVNIRSAAKKGLLSLSDDKPGFISENLKNSPPELKAGIIMLLRELPPDKLNGKDLFETEGLETQDKILLLTVLSGRNDKSIHTVAVDFAKSSVPELRNAGLKVLMSMATPDDIPLITCIAAGESGTEKDMARKVLYGMPGIEADKMIVSTLANSEPAVKIELIRALGERNNTSVTEALLREASGNYPEVQSEAVKVLGKTGDYKYVPEILRLLKTASSEELKSELEKCAYLMSARNPDIKSRSAVISAALKQASAESEIIPLLSLLGKSGDTDVYPVIKEYFANSEPGVQAAAARSVSEWSDPVPVDDLKKSVKSSDQKVHSIALRSLIQITDKTTSISDAVKIKNLNEIFLSARNSDEQKLVVASYGRIATLESLKSLVKLMTKTEIVPEVEAAITGITPVVHKVAPAEAAQELKAAIKLSSDEEFRSWAAEGLANKTFNQ